MKIAALILAHRNKAQLERLIRALSHPDIDIYIHLDKKSSLSPEDFRHLDVRFTEKRIDVSLFEFSMVEAEIELLRTACAQGDYGYHMLLSGQCYPLRHIDDIHAYLSAVYPRPLIEVISPKLVTKFARQFRYPHTLKRFRTGSFAFLQKYLPTKSIYPYKYVPEAIVFAATVLRGLFVKSPAKRLEAMGLEPYFGPQWWILPDVSIDGILSSYDDPDFRSCMTDCFSCDETFFQTAIMRQAENLGITLAEDGYYRNKKWFTIFSHGHPILLTREHYDQLIVSNMLFARKFDLDADTGILDLLDEHSLALKNTPIPDWIL